MKALRPNRLIVGALTLVLGYIGLGTYVDKTTYSSSFMDDTEITSAVRLDESDTSIRAMASNEVEWNKVVVPSQKRLDRKADKKIKKIQSQSSHSVVRDEPKGRPDSINVSLDIFQVINKKRFKKELFVSSDSIDGSIHVIDGEVESLNIEAYANNKNIQIELSSSKIKNRTFSYPLDIVNKIGDVEERMFSGFFSVMSEDEIKVHFVNGPYKGTVVTFLSDNKLQDIEEKRQEARELAEERKLEELDRLNTSERVETDIDPEEAKEKQNASVRSYEGSNNDNERGPSSEEEFFDEEDLDLKKDENGDPVLSEGPRHPFSF